MKQKSILIWAISFITVAIVLGAFGAHALKTRLSLDQLISFETGVKYQMYHGLALLCLASLVPVFRFNYRLSIQFLILGTLFFSVSIYGLALQDLVGWNLSFLGPITPIGGVVLLVGWIHLGWKIVQSKSE